MEIVNFGDWKCSLLAEACRGRRRGKGKIGNSQMNEPIKFNFDFGGGGSAKA